MDPSIATRLVGIALVLVVGVLAHFYFRWASEAKLGDATLTFNALSFVQALTAGGTAYFLGRSWELWQTVSVLIILFVSILVQSLMTMTFTKMRERWRAFIGTELHRCLNETVWDNADRRESLRDVGTHVVEQNYIPNSPTQNLERWRSTGDLSPRDQQREDWLKFLRRTGLLNDEFTLLSEEDLLNTDLFRMNEEQRRGLGKRYLWLGIVSILLLVFTTVVVAVST